MTTMKSMQLGLGMSALLAVGCAMGNETRVGNDVAFLHSTEEAPAGCESVKYKSQDYSFSLLESSLVAVLDEAGRVVCVDASEAVAEDLVEQRQASQATVLLSWGAGDTNRTNGRPSTVDAISQWVLGDGRYRSTPDPEPMSGGTQPGSAQGSTPDPEPMIGGAQPGSTQGGTPDPEPMIGGAQPGSAQGSTPDPEPMIGGTQPSTTNRGTPGQNNAAPGAAQGSTPDPEPMIPR